MIVVGASRPLSDIRCTKLVAPKRSVAHLGAHTSERRGFAPQKPMKKLYGQSPAAVKKWLETEYPVIAACAKGESAEFRRPPTRASSASFLGTHVLFFRNRRSRPPGLQGKRQAHRGSEDASVVGNSDLVLRQCAIDGAGFVLLSAWLPAKTCASVVLSMSFAMVGSPSTSQVITLQQTSVDCVLGMVLDSHSMPMTLRTDVPSRHNRTHMHRHGRKERWEMDTRLLDGGAPALRRRAVSWLVRAMATGIVLSSASTHGQTQSAGTVVAKNAQAVEVQAPGGSRVRLYGESHALVIGAAHYRLGWPSLPGVIDDVRAVAKLFGEQGFSVTTVVDPTRDELDKALRRFVELHGQQVDNRLVIYFAGHGYTLKTAAYGRLGYIVPVDAPRPGPNGLNVPAFKSAAYSMESIEDLARQIDAKHALFIFDSCFSGTIFRTRGGAVPDSITENTSKPVRQFITAGDDNQQVPDQSLFRRQLEAGLRGGADFNKDGYITGSELGFFLEDRVTNYSRRSQTPRWGKIRDPELDLGDFVFTYGAKDASRGSAALGQPASPGTRGSGGDLVTPPPRESLTASPVAASGLQQRLSGAAYYDPQLKATILADGNLPATLPLRVPGIDAEGKMSSATATVWVAALNASAYLGYRDWRLPLARPINGVTYNFVGAHDGGTDLGYNLSAPGTRFEGSTSSELAYLYFNPLGARARHSVTGAIQNNASNQFAPLRNVAFRSYWISTPYADGSLAFSFADGTQYAFAPGWKFNVIVLRSGDVGTESAAVKN
jgi:hypothetical protein